MTYKELCTYIQSPRILNLLLDHFLGKPVEKHEQEQRMMFRLSWVSQEVKPAQEEGIIVGGKEMYMLEGE